mgnify:CR=1 FL=1
MLETLIHSIYYYRWKEIMYKNCTDSLKHISLVALKQIFSAFRKMAWQYSKRGMQAF